MNYQRKRETRAVIKNMLRDELIVQRDSAQAEEHRSRERARRLEGKNEYRSQLEGQRRERQESKEKEMRFLSEKEFAINKRLIEEIEGCRGVSPDEQEKLFSAGVASGLLHRSTARSLHRSTRMIE